MTQTRPSRAGARNHHPCGAVLPSRWEDATRRRPTGFTTIVTRPDEPTGKQQVTS